MIVLPVCGSSMKRNGVIGHVVYFRHFSLHRFQASAGRVSHPTSAESQSVTSEKAQRLGRGN
jgi:hypothetical protein